MVGKEMWMLSLLNQEIIIGKLRCSKAYPACMGPVVVSRGTLAVERGGPALTWDKVDWKSRASKANTHCAPSRVAISAI